MAPNVIYAYFFAVKCVVYIFYPKPYIIFRRRFKGVGNLNEVLRAERIAVKTAFLSYYISMYNAVNKEIGYDDAPVTVDEIYDFIQDLKHEDSRQIPDIRKEDISLCFHLLQMAGVCPP